MAKPRGDPDAGGLGGDQLARERVPLEGSVLGGRTDERREGGRAHGGDRGDDAAPDFRKHHSRRRRRGLGLEHAQELAVAREEQVVLEGAPQRPERAHYAGARVPHALGRVARHVLPVGAVVGRTAEDDLLDPPAQLDVESLGGKETLVGRGLPFHAARHEGGERVGGGANVPE